MAIFDVSSWFFRGISLLSIHEFLRVCLQKPINSHSNSRPIICLLHFQWSPHSFLLEPGRALWLLGLFFLHWPDPKLWFRHQNSERMWAIVSEKIGFSYLVNASKINSSVVSTSPVKCIRKTHDLLLPEIHYKNLRVHPAYPHLA